MTETSNPPASADLIDRLVGLDAGSTAFRARHERAKVAAATQASYDALLDPGLAGLGLDERLLVALLACRLTPCPVLADHYRARLGDLGADRVRIEAADAGRSDSGAGPRLQAILAFTRTLIEKPIEGDRAALQALLDAGLGTAAVVALAQLIAFVSYQTRLVAGLQAMQASPGALAAQPAEPAAGAARAAARDAADAPRPVGATAALRPVVESHGFTNRTVGWKAWLDVVDLDRATPLQAAVLEESHPQARSSDYYRTLVHQPEILRQRSAAFNAIMYAPGGLPRAERELASTVVSRINGCVYCASVHAQRFEQLARRNDTIAQVFDDPAGAGTSPRERAIVDLSIALTADPGRGATGAVAALGACGLGTLEVLDLIHAVAIFAWANRLMLNLGEPVLPAP